MTTMRINSGRKSRPCSTICSSNLVDAKGVQSKGKMVLVGHGVFLFGLVTLRIHLTNHS